MLKKLIPNSHAEFISASHMQDSRHEADLSCEILKQVQDDFLIS